MRTACAVAPPPGAIATGCLAIDHGRTNGLFSSEVGRLDIGAVQKQQDGVAVVEQMKGETDANGRFPAAMADLTGATHPSIDP